MVVPLIVSGMARKVVFEIQNSKWFSRCFLPGGGGAGGGGVQWRPAGLLHQQAIIIIVIIAISWNGTKSSRSLVPHLACCWRYSILVFIRSINSTLIIVIWWNGPKTSGSLVPHLASCWRYSILVFCSINSTPTGRGYNLATGFASALSLSLPPVTKNFIQCSTKVKDNVKAQLTDNV